MAKPPIPYVKPAETRALPGQKKSDYGSETSFDSGRTVFRRLRYTLKTFHAEEIIEEESWFEIGRYGV